MPINDDDDLRRNGRGITSPKNLRVLLLLALLGWLILGGVAAVAWWLFWS